MVRAPLTGKLFDAEGAPMSPTFSRGKSGRRYRYYVSASLQHGGTDPERSGMRRISATALESILSETVSNWTANAETPLDQIRCVRVVRSGLTVEVTAASKYLAFHLAPHECIVKCTSSTTTVHVALSWPLRGDTRWTVNRDPNAPRPDPTLIKALRSARQMIEHEASLPLVRFSPASPYNRTILRLAFLAPDLQRDILAGRQPRSLNLERLRKMDIPLAWAEQRKVLGWPATG